MPRANNLKTSRLKSGLTLRQVATLMNMQCESRISQWEHGTAMPSIFNFLKLCQVYQVDPREVYLSLSDTPQEPSP